MPSCVCLENIDDQIITSVSMRGRGAIVFPVKYDQVFSEERYKKWLPYYEKLKAEVLPTIEPKYNL